MVEALSALQMFELLSIWVSQSEKILKIQDKYLH